jgi:hypothetical protein
MENFGNKKDSSYFIEKMIKMMKNDNNSLLQFYIIKNFYDGIEPSLNNNTDLNLKNLVKQLSYFCQSEKFYIYFIGELKDEKESQPFVDFLIIYEAKENYLSLKIFFLLLEELKIRNFDKQIIEIYKQYETAQKNLYKAYDLYFNKHKNSLIEFIDNPKTIKDSKFTKMFATLLTEKISESEHYKKLWNLYKLFLFYDILYKTKNGGKKDNNLLYTIFKDIKHISFDKNEIINIVNILIQINGLNHIKNTYQIFIYLLNLIKNEKQLYPNIKIDNQFFKNLGDPFELKERIIWTLYEENSNQIKILNGKMTEREKFNLDIFDFISQINTKINIDGMRGSLFESIFYNKTIFVIEIDHKKNLTNLERIQNDIKLLKDSCPLGYNNLDTYAKIENKIINLDNSYDLFIQELKIKKIIEEDIKIDTKNKIYENKIDNNIRNKELEELRLQLTNEKEKNKILEEKNKKYERDLKERGINKGEEQLRKELDNEIKKYNNLKKQIEEEKALRMTYGKETKESFIETIIEKDKKIRELELKISRFPFILEEGEVLMSIIFISSDQNLHYSVICKNTDEFYKIESQIYKKYPEYTENENFFILNGKKINRYKTLEQNGVKNNDIIILNEFVNDN